MRALAALLLAVALLPAAVRAETTGEIAGKVLDSHGVPIAGVTVSATSAAQVVRAQTDARGSFAFVDLLPGMYAIAFQKSGYEPVTCPGIVVLAGRERYLKFMLSRVWTISGTVSPSAFELKWGSNLQTADLYKLNPSTDPYFESFDRWLDLWLVPGVQTSGTNGAKF